MIDSSNSNRFRSMSAGRTRNARSEIPTPIPTPKRQINPSGPTGTYMEINAKGDGRDGNQVGFLPKPPDSGNEASVVNYRSPGFGKTPALNIAIKGSDRSMPPSLPSEDSRFKYESNSYINNPSVTPSSVSSGGILFELLYDSNFSHVTFL